MSEKTKELFCQPVYERALLSYCFKSVDNYYDISAMVTAEDFLRPEHKLIYTIFSVLIKRKVAGFDASLIATEAKKDGVLQDIGGYEYIGAIIDMQVGSENISYYMHKVLDASTKYKLHIKLETHRRLLEKNAQSEETSSVDLMNMVEADVMDLSMNAKFIKEPRNLSDGLDEYVEDRRVNPVTICGISSGFPIMDKLLDGMVPGTLQVVCARPKVGKSSFLSCVATYVAYTLRKPVLYIDTEMPFNQWRDRVIAMLSGVEERRVKHGGYSDDEYSRIKKAVALIKGSKLFHEFMPGYTVDKLVSIYKKYKVKENIGFAIFDYIKEPKGESNTIRKEYQLLGDVTTVLKDLAGELDIPFLVANQINRQDDIADSDRILRYADVIAFFIRRTSEELKDIEDKFGPFKNDYGTHKLWIKESRRGGTTPAEGIGFIFKKKTLTIHEAKRQMIDYDSSEYSRKEETEEDNDNTTSSTTSVNVFKDADDDAGF